jgi:hypothetical protein
MQLQRYNNLSFLRRDGLMDMKVVLLKSEINSELSLPTNVIQTISVMRGEYLFLQFLHGNFVKY